MREIQFRGKVSSEILYGNIKSDGTWVYGFYKDKLGLPTISEFDLSRANYVDYEIDRTTLGQYINKVDKNNVKVYEDDIVKYVYEYQDGTAESIGFVYYNYERSTFCVRYRLDDFETDDFFEDMVSFEVIGNIHDNPELLEEGL